ncbi:iron(II)-dependent oxidoreductase EgtB [Roseovarius sp. A-2]|uniref:ergothioneine biosynthesis protein EgtB n=1 Tax=Roseovarius sp. A-2 TaxID=1570360 RepID=UPI0009B50709|nr:ergothioneine biosynthesis protein EgtB [Roseovarius sp. A-2]GAW37360.1 iron(II)-dependent oxidoreductase EgtB [Roseovarius sp. A-2]
MLPTARSHAPDHDLIIPLFDEVRTRTEQLAAPLTPEDAMLQSMEEASPPKWHLAHTTWFFEEFVLKPYLPSYQTPDDRFAFLFNSYYVQAGPRHARDKRGLISRPALREVMSYREHVTEAISALLCSNRSDRDDIAALVELGSHHEMQHQELLVTDLLHALSCNPLLVAYRPPDPVPPAAETEMGFTHHDGGLVETGHKGTGFAYDCEQPRHQGFLEPYRLADRPVINRDWIAFIDDGGYTTQTLWLNDGWAICRKQDWDTPLYWWRQDDEWWSYTLRGAQPVLLDAPVCHVSYYEADAFARWAGARLPSEVEWEAAFADTAIDGNFLESGALRPRPEGGAWGDIWEWTKSPFTSYPGFRPPEGAIGEYNGKFMINQMVLRGGSCATPVRQMRPSYRNFFYPQHRWQMMGLRLAQNA